MTESLPWHPILVHMPLALGVLMPLIGLAALIAWRRDWLPGRRLWIAVVALQAVLVGSGIAAVRSGGAEEDRVEEVVSRRLVHEHEERAESFVWGAGAVLAVAVLAALLPGDRLRRNLAAAALVGMAVVAVLGYRTGQAGGELVYRHGAAAVYATPAGDSAAQQPAGGSEGNQPGD